MKAVFSESGEYLRNTITEEARLLGSRSLGCENLNGNQPFIQNGFGVAIAHADAI
jgi:hypothetical protein